MDEYDKMVTSQRRWMLYLLAIFVIGALLTPFRKLFLGLLLGGSVSLMNLALLQKKAKKFGESAVGKGSGTGLGTLTRTVTFVLSVMVALRFEDVFSVYGVIIGLATLYGVIIVESFVRAFNEVKRT